MSLLNPRAPAILAVVIGCSAADVTAPPIPQLNCSIPDNVASTIVFTGVNVVPMDQEAVLTNHTVMVDDGVIAALGPDGSVEIPEGATVIDECTGFLTPGLADMHVHMQSGDIDSYLRSGITTVRNLWGYPGLAQLIDDIDQGNRLGPTIYSVSPGLDGNPPKWPFTQTVLDPALADSSVQVQADSGWTTLKMYQDLSRSVYDAIVDAARLRGFDFVGHVPHRVGLIRVLEVGQKSIEHLSGYELELNGGTTRGAFGWREIDESLIPNLVTRTVAAGTWNCPTLAIFSRLANGDEVVVENRRQMIKAIHDGGGRLLVGTDSGIGVTDPGVSIHEELAEFVAAGLTPYEALRAATVDAAEFLGEGFGVVAVGAPADLLMLAGNPLDNVTVASEPALVLLGGKILPN